MRKRIFGAMAAVTVCALIGFNVALSSQINRLSDITLASAGDLTNNEQNIHAGGVANKHCPIWNVTYSVGSLWPSVTCSTGGEYKCEAGQCPH